MVKSDNRFGLTGPSLPRACKERQSIQIVTVRQGIVFQDYG